MPRIKQVRVSVGGTTNTSVLPSLDEEAMIIPRPKLTPLTFSVENPDPVIVTCVPTPPDVGLMLETTGVAVTIVCAEAIGIKTKLDNEKETPATAT